MDLRRYVVFSAVEPIAIGTVFDLEDVPGGKAVVIAESNFLEFVEQGIALDDPDRAPFFYRVIAE